MHFIHPQVVSLLFHFQRWCGIFSLEFLHSGILHRDSYVILYLSPWNSPCDNSFHPLSLFICILLTDYEVTHAEVFFSLSKMSILDCYHCSMAQAKPALPLNQLVRQEIRLESQLQEQQLV